MAGMTTPRSTPRGEMSLVTDSNVDEDGNFYVDVDSLQVSYDYSRLAATII